MAKNIFFHIADNMQKITINNEWYAEIIGNTHEELASKLDAINRAINDLRAHILIEAANYDEHAFCIDCHDTRECSGCEEGMYQQDDNFYKEK